MPKFQPELIITRIVSGRGLIQIPEEYRSCRRMWLYAEIARYPEPDYRNKKYPREKGNFANILWLQEGYVCKQEVMEFEKQRWSWLSDEVGQVLYDAQCIAVTETKNLKTVAEALGAFVVLSPFDPVELMEQDYDSIVVECRDGAGVILRLYGQKYDRCPDQEESKKTPPEPPPPPAPPLEPGELLDGKNGRLGISPPYQEPDDDGDTVPDEGDAPPPPPLPPYQEGSCEKYVLQVRLDYVQTNGQPGLQRTYVTIYSPFGGFEYIITGNGRRVCKIKSRGRSVSPSASLQSPPILGAVCANAEISEEIFEWFGSEGTATIEDYRKL